jgi:FlaA1/EpsC-like NDP-sugar epimerase
MAFLAVLDVIAFNLSYVLSYLIRFEFDVHSVEFGIYFPAYAHNLILLTVIKLVLFIIFAMYKRLWIYAGPEDLLRVVGACVVSSLAAMAVLILMQQTPPMPRGIYVMSFVFDTILTGGIRFTYRYLRTTKSKRQISGMFTFSRKAAEPGVPSAKRVMLVGAGDAGANIIREVRANPAQSMRIEVAVDDDPSKRGSTILGEKIVGGRIDIRILVRRYSIDEIIIAIPSASKKQIQAIVTECNKTKCKVQILPSLMDLIDERVSVNSLRDVNIEDLLGRDPVKLDIREISGYLEGRIVMVTGGGGSIGSELCRQIARFKPRRLIVLDNYENGAFELANELNVILPRLELEVVIGSVRDNTRMRQVFKKYKPHVVFHAAAHKHVPLMEFNPGEAVANNVLGTKNVADLADQFAVEKFVMISTDKAVNPSNVMGATKRLAEMVVQEKSRTSRTAFAVVRFGNVLGSNGSVIPIFRRQIEQGGPVTVTDKDITRYFMTIPEAVQLVVQAGAMTEGGEIFILDMGEPVKILDLAENMVKLSGLVPYEDIDIVITQLRPGEKIHEELSYENEQLKKTAHEKIFLGRSTEPTPELSITLKSETSSLERIIEERVSRLSEAEVKDWLHHYLPSYRETQKRSVMRGVRIQDE